MFRNPTRLREEPIASARQDHLSMPGYDFDDIGVYRPSTRQFYMDVDGSGGWTPGTDAIASFGTSGDLPIIGDW